MEGFIAGVIITFWAITIFLSSCDEFTTMGKMDRGVIYEGKVYHSVIDSVRTDSLHAWRKK